MSSSSATTSDLVFFSEKPKVLYIDEDYSIPCPAHSSIDKLMKSLQENGPLVAEGKMGPAAYTKKSFTLQDKVEGQEIDGWVPGSFNEHASNVQVILLGATKTASNSYVYYTSAEDITKNKECLIRGIQPLSKDSKIYVMSYKNFHERSLVNLHPLCPQGSWLYSVDANSILRDSDTKKKCKQVGQQIFDHYKKVRTDDSEAGREAVQRICEAARFLTADGVVRKSHIEAAWDGIGDKNWTWMR